MAFASALGWVVFFISIVIAVILFIRIRKFYPIMYLISISIYAFTVGLMIEVYMLSESMVLLLLVVSSFLMMLIGYYLKRRSQ